MLALTIIAGVILWGFRIDTPPPAPSVTWEIHSGGSNPVWGDPTDCQPQGYTLASYESPSFNPYKWAGNHNDGSSSDTWWGQCENSVTGNFSMMNSSEIVVAGTSPTNIPLSEITLSFVCNNASSNGGITTLVSGSLASMTWYPGSSSQPAPNAPLLGYCGSFNAGGFNGAAYGTYYNRLGLFVPLAPGATTLQGGDTFILYLHNGGWPIDFECVANYAGVYFIDETTQNGCLHQSLNNPSPVPQSDYDDYHGAPPWCFTSPSACTIYLTYTGTPATVLATIPVYSLAPPSS